ncbi:hypothetical protein [Riemerella anatipestifer]|uniref:hypothetical protein n=1 Tax=Riemerella anatipestifer TaxID=34085 RepID=UPI00188AA590|nr:hypothetical protein [Riemerella anatipestifer]QOZ86122.1 hypothetical protein D1J34_01120 [Riemerella anatipestifer]
MKKLSTIIKEKLEIDIDEGRFPFKYSYEQYLKDNSEFNNLMETTKLLNEEFKKDLEFDIEYFDFIINKNTQLVLSLSEYFDKTEKAKNDYSIESYSYNSLNHFWMVFTVITNNYIALKELFTNGKDYQGKVLFRNTIELTELCIGILGDEEFYNFFKKENNVNHPTKNYQTLKFDVIKKVSNKIITQIKNLPNNNMNNELWDEYLKMRNEYYDDTSKHTHSNFFNLMLNSHVPLKNNEQLGLSDLIIHNLNGIISVKTDENIDQVFLYDSISYMILVILIVDKHKLNFNKLDVKKDYLAILTGNNWELLRYRERKNYT